MSLAEHFGAPRDPVHHDALRRALGVLASLGVWSLSDEWSQSLAVWSHGRAPAVAALPYALVALSGAAALHFTLARRWRLGGAVFSASFPCLYALAPVTYHNNLYLLWLYVLLATLTGGALARTWAFPRLVQWQLAIVYLGSVAVKLSHPCWQGSGEVIRWLATVRVPWQHQGLVNPVAAPLLARHDVSAFLDAMTIAAEVFVPVALATRWRRAALAAGVALHVTLQEWLYPQLFTFLMFWAYFAHSPAGDRAWRATYDPASRFDAALARWYPRLDWLARTTWHPGHTLTLTGPDGRVRDATGALRALHVLTPVTVLAYAALALAAPGTQQVFTVPRDALENLVVVAWASFFVPGLWEGAVARVRALPTRTGP